MTYKVYKITNIITSQIYFGFTSKSLKQRFSEHVNTSNHKTYLNCVLHHSIRKYDKSNFIIELLYSFTTEYEAKSTEIFLIARYQTNKSRYRSGIGMNLTDGGEGTSGLTRKVSEKTKAIWQKNRQGSGNSFYGKTHTIKTKQQIGKANSKKVKKYSLDNKYIETFSSTTSAGKSCNVTRQAIYHACKTNRPCKGYFWYRIKP